VATRDMYHLAVYNLVENTRSHEWHILRTDKDTLLCGRENEPSIGIDYRKLIRNLTENDMRIQAAEMQNNDQPVCADCVAAMYTQRY